MCPTFLFCTEDEYKLFTKDLVLQNYRTTYMETGGFTSAIYFCCMYLSGVGFGFFLGFHTPPPPNYLGFYNLD